ncbi:GNAT family N-acetyltransferase [Chthonobacter rhizosphaerae]|uniref:GNAT family N-acetyltransferase n=1 Tax=Chthonobacter rhizosphaerae TaxID=2735553 RepID=UPI0015EF12B7|nr:GNAT family N-acetyltransferase [Chthonobacter rhizosphaerae]
MPIRPATAADVPRIEAIVAEAYALYVPRIGKPPAPMLADYAAHVAAGQVHVLEEAGAILGAVVFWPEPDHLYLDMVAVDPAAKGRGFGRRLVTHAEAEARRLGRPEVRLNTNARMTENLTLYPRLGYHETARRHHEGYDRVFFAKPLT